jgi:hypothetical protein
MVLMLMSCWVALAVPVVALLAALSRGGALEGGPLEGGPLEGGPLEGGATRLWDGGAPMGCFRRERVESHESR